MNLKKNLAIADNGFVFNPANGDSFSTNPIGAEILAMLKTGQTVGEIRNQILANYDTDEATFEKDFYDFVNQLRQHRLSE